MLTIPMRKWGETLGTRGLGAEARQYIAAALSEGETTVDFTGVQIATQGFLDEAIGKLAGEVSVDTLKTRCRFAGMNTTIAGLVRMVIVERRRQSDTFESQSG